MSAAGTAADLEAFTEEQKQYLQGFVAGSGIARSLASLPVLGAGGATFAATLGLTPDQLPRARAVPADASTGPEAIHAEARQATEARGGKLCNEEAAKREKNPLDFYDEMAAHAQAGRFPKGIDVFRFKFHGLFYVAPAQDAFMCRLRFPAGLISSHQMKGVADLAERYGGGYADITTRANLQIRQIKPTDTLAVLHGLQDLGIVNRGSGADNIRNITASPTAGIDPSELIDTRPLARELHHYILNHREMYGLPRKFNIAFDGGGAVTALEDTNDIGFAAVRVGEGKAIPAGVYFRVALAGITGHKDFARETGLLVTPQQCLPMAVAIVRAFIEHGDRTNRTKARLKYVIDRMGVDGFMIEVRKHLPESFGTLYTLPLDQCEPRPRVDPTGHVGVHPQAQPGLNYIGVVTPVGRLTCQQMRGLARVADRFGSGTIRLTVWENLIISDVPADDVAEAVQAIEQLGLAVQASAFRTALVACTGNTGCKFAAANTKKHALQIATYLESRLTLDQPVNIHVTGCPHSCAQHFIGDIGLLATKVPVGEEMVEGYHIFLGGGYGEQQSIGREICRNVTAEDAPQVVERIVRAYIDHRSSEAETFAAFVRRHPTEELKTLVGAEVTS